MGKIAEMRSQAERDLEEGLYDRILADWTTALQRVTEQTAERIAEASSPMTAALDTLAQDLVSLSEDHKETVKAILQALAQARETVEADMAAAVQRADDVMARAEQTVETVTQDAQASITQAQQAMTDATEAAKTAVTELQAQAQATAKGLRRLTILSSLAAVFLIGSALPIALAIWRPALLVGLWHLAQAVHGH